MTNIKTYNYSHYIEITAVEDNIMKASIGLSRNSEKELALVLATAVDAGFLTRDKLYRMLDAAFEYTNDKDLSIPE